MRTYFACFYNGVVKECGETQMELKTMKKKINKLNKDIYELGKKMNPTSNDDSKVEKIISTVVEKRVHEVVKKYIEVE